MKRSKRKHFQEGLIAMVVIGAVIIATALIIPNLLEVQYLDIVSKYALLFGCVLTIIPIIWLVLVIIRCGGIKSYISKERMIYSLENNLMGIGAYKEREGVSYVNLPKIRIKNNEIHISLKDIKIREKIQKSIDSFSTALPERFIVEDYYITPSNNELIIQFEDIENYQQEELSLSQLKSISEVMGNNTFYIDRKHNLNVQDYVHLIVSGTTGFGKSYAAQQLVVQALFKDWEVSVLDIKRSYGLYRKYIEYVVEPEDILKKLLDIEKEMYSRLSELESHLDTNPRALATDIGYKNKLVLIEEFISLQTALDKKQREELERVVKNLSVLARQACIHLILVMQAAGTENINSSTRAQFTKILLGNAQSNILNATFGNGVDIPNIKTKLNKGEGFIQLDRISIVRFPKIEDMENISQYLPMVNESEEKSDI